VETGAKCQKNSNWKEKTRQAQKKTENPPSTRQKAGRAVHRKLSGSKPGQYKWGRSDYHGVSGGDGGDPDDWYFLGNLNGGTSAVPGERAC